MFSRNNVTLYELPVTVKNPGEAAICYLGAGGEPQWWPCTLAGRKVLFVDAPPEPFDPRSDEVVDGQFADLIKAHPSAAVVWTYDSGRRQQRKWLLVNGQVTVYELCQALDALLGSALNPPEQIRARTVRQLAADTPDSSSSGIKLVYCSTGP